MYRPGTQLASQHWFSYTLSAEGEPPLRKSARYTALTGLLAYLPPFLHHLYRVMYTYRLVHMITCIIYITEKYIIIA